MLLVFFDRTLVDELIHFPAFISSPNFHSPMVKLHLRPVMYAIHAPFTDSGLW